MAIMEYINDNLPWACMPFAGGSRGSIYTVYKGLDKGAVGQMMAAVMTHATAAPKDKKDKEINAIMEVLKDHGVRYPAFFIGEFDTSSTERTTRVQIIYKTKVNLDYADPNFFDYLDQVLDHIKLNDDLSAFSLESRNAV